MSVTRTTRTEPLRLEVLHDTVVAGPNDLPIGLLRAYGGALGLDGRRTYANLVASVDGVAALGMAHSPAVISRRSQADRFVMGLLRARADAVLVGGATLRADPGHDWTAEHIYPDAAADWRALRRANGQGPRPRLVVVTSSGEVDPREPALENALFVAPEATAARLRRILPSSAGVRALEDVSGAALWAVLRDEGLDLVLSEGGPGLFGELVASGCVDELFLTVSPVLAGSDAPGRKTLSGGLALGDALATMDLASARRHGSHLLLRYRFGDQAPLRPS